MCKEYELAKQSIADTLRDCFGNNSRHALLLTSDPDFVNESSYWDGFATTILSLANDDIEVGVIIKKTGKKASY